MTWKKVSTTWKSTPDACWRHKNGRQYIENLDTIDLDKIYYPDVLSKSKTVLLMNIFLYFGLPLLVFEVWSILYTVDFDVQAHAYIIIHHIQNDPMN